MGIVLDRELLNQPREKYWISYIKSRIKKNKNFLGFISGQTGSGKSYCSLRIAEELDSDFSIERVVFSGLELMKLINNGNLKRGTVIVFEEAGVEMSNKNWASVTNKMLNYLIQTFRHRGFILIMNSPYMDFIDSATRKLFHAEFQTMGIDFNKEVCKVKPQLIQYNARLQKFYYKKLRVIREEGNIPISFWTIDKPSKVLVVDYEKKKRVYTNTLNLKIMSELESLENKDRNKNKLTEIQQEVVDLLNEGMTIPQIAAKRNRTVDVVYKNLELIKKKGYKIEQERSGNQVIRYRVAVTEGL